MIQSTSTPPQGDLTPWCAAFVNWCLMTAADPYPKSAASGTFRYWKKKTETPVLGDIVVFKSSDPVKAKELHGHVGFFVSQDETRVQVLGGNQINRAGHHEISQVWFLKSGGGLELDSFRTGLNLAS